MLQSNDSHYPQKNKLEFEIIAFRAILTESHLNSPQLMQLQFKLHSILRDLVLYKITFCENYNILLKTLTSWAQRDKTLQETVTFTDQKKIAYWNIRIQKAFWRKLNNLKPLAVMKSFTSQKRSNALASVGKSCRSETITAENQYASHDP